MGLPIVDQVHSIEACIIATHPELVDNDSFFRKSLIPLKEHSAFCPSMVLLVDWRSSASRSNFFLVLMVPLPTYQLLVFL
jgi:hypothetical protein